MRQDRFSMEFLAFMDGAPVALFDGTWYCSLDVELRGLYELPLDMEKIYAGEPISMTVKYNYERIQIENPEQIVSAATVIFLLNDGSPQLFFGRF